MKMDSDKQNKSKGKIMKGRTYLTIFIIFLLLFVLSNIGFSQQEDNQFLPENVQLEVDPHSGEAPLNVTISMSAENIGTANGTLNLTIDGMVEHEMEFPAESEKSEEIIYTFNDPGTYLLAFGNEWVTVNVEETPPTNNDIIDTPGFTILSLIIIFGLMILIYRRKH